MKKLKQRIKKMSKAQMLKRIDELVSQELKRNLNQREEQELEILLDYNRKN